MFKLVLAGGSGFLGQAFAAYAAEQGYACVILSRHPSRVNEVYWDGKSLGEWQQHIDGAAAVINFTGKSVNCIYTPENKQEIIDSRINSVKVLAQAIRLSDKAPQTFIQAGSLAIFGDTQEDCTEDSAHGEGFSVSVCEQWEAAFAAEHLPDTRKCFLRIGFVLGPNGGALSSLRLLAKLFLGGSVGKGTQYISWLHNDDFNKMLMLCLKDESLNGIFNATSPSPVTNKVFMHALRRSVGRPWSPPTPRFAVKIGAALFLRTDPSLALTGRKCYPQRFVQHGFTFSYNELQEALDQIMAEWA